MKGTKPKKQKREKPLKLHGKLDDLLNIVLNTPQKKRSKKKGKK